MSGGCQGAMRCMMSTIHVLHKRVDHPMENTAGLVVVQFTIYIRLIRTLEYDQLLSFV